MYVYEASGVTHNHIDSMIIIEQHMSFFILRIVFYFSQNIKNTILYYITSTNINFLTQCYCFFLISPKYGERLLNG